MSTLRVSIALASILAGCGGSTTQSTPPPSTDAGDQDTGAPPPDDDAGAPAPDAGDNGAPSEVYPAPHPDPPKVVSLGGPVLKSPKLVPVFFPSDAMQAQLEDFLKTFGGTDFFGANVAEYGVGAAVAKASIVLTETAPTTIDDSAIKSWLQGKITSAAAGFAAPEADTIFVLYYPAGTTITMQGGIGGTATSCQQFGGYHNSVSAGGKDVSYAVIPRCGTFGDLHGIDGVTAGTSHEVIEASTDPYPEVTPAFATVDNDHVVWSLLGGETGDLCAQFPSSFYKPAGYAYTVQRSWSNKLAKAGHDPCAPQIDGEVYFNSAPVMDETVTFDLGGQGGKTHGVQIAVGQSKTIDVDLFSDAKTSGPWKVTALDAITLQTGGAPSLKFSFDRTSGVNGEKLHLTITAVSRSILGASPFILESSLGSQRNLWVGLVVN